MDLLMNHVFINGRQKNKQELVEVSVVENETHIDSFT